MSEEYKVGGLVRLRLKWGDKPEGTICRITDVIKGSCGCGGLQPTIGIDGGHPKCWYYSHLERETGNKFGLEKVNSWRDLV